MTRLLLILASLTIVLAGAKAASALLVPFLVAVFFAILLAPPYLALNERGVPVLISLILMILGLIFIGGLSLTILKTSLEQFVADAPRYEEELRVRLSEVWKWLEANGFEAPDEIVMEALDPRFALNYAGRFARALSGLLGQIVLIFIIIAFMLVEARSFRAKLEAIDSVSAETITALEQNFTDVRHYVSLKTVMSLLTAALVWVLLWMLDVPNALFLVLLAFFLNFIPTIGSIIAAVPGVLIVFILMGPLMATVAAVGYLAVNIFVSNIIEPRFMGHGLGVSPLVIILSLVFWGWLFGPIGMLLSIPLTLVLKALLEIDHSTKSFAMLLGPSPQTATTSTQLRNDS